VSRLSSIRDERTIDDSDVRVAGLMGYPELFQVTAPILVYEDVVGSLRLVFRRTHILSEHRRSLLWTVCIGSVLFAVGMLVYARITCRLTEPLRRAVHQLGDLAQGDADLSLRLPEDEVGEIGGLGAAFNAFMRHLGELVRRVQRGPWVPEPDLGSG